MEWNIAVKSSCRSWALNGAVKEYLHQYTTADESRSSEGQSQAVLVAASRALADLIMIRAPVHQRGPARLIQRPSLSVP